MDSKTLSDLIGLIYDAAFDVRHWPRLFQILSDELDALADKAPDSKKNELSRNGLIELLRSHFIRALELNREIFEAREQRDVMSELLERLPLGMMIVDSESNVLTYNSKLVPIVSNGKGLSIKNNILNAQTPLDTARLRRAIRDAANNDTSDGRTIHLSNPDDAVPLSALIVPFTSNTEIDSKPKAVLLVAAPKTHFEISTDTLRSLYRLTGAEAKLVSSLIKDCSLNTIAEDFGISKHTIRNQLKSVYEKTGTHRQAELVRRVVTGPAMLATISQRESPNENGVPTQKRLVPPHRSTSLLNQTMRLPDGRLLGFAEYGDPNGQPVVLMHAANGSRLERHPDETIIQRCKVRLIIPDRPGAGLSDQNPHMTLLNWADDVENLANHLKLNRFCIIGYSMGAPFALACAYKFGHRIDRQVLVSGMVPFDSIWELDGMYPPFRLYLFCAKHASSLLEPAIRLFGIKVSAESNREELVKHLPPVDQALLCDTSIKERIRENEIEYYRQREPFILPEGVLIAKNWGFAPEGIRVPTEFWHGELDRIVPLDLVRRFAKRLPDCRINLLPEAGHYLLYHCWREILLSAVSEPVVKENLSA